MGINDQLTFKFHIASVAWSCWFALYNIRKLRPYQSDHTAQLKVQDLVSVPIYLSPLFFFTPCSYYALIGKRSYIEILLFLYVASRTTVSLPRGIVQKLAIQPKKTIQAIKKTNKQKRKKKIIQLSHRIYRI